jgi:hypothetical protein
MNDFSNIDTSCVLNQKGAAILLTVVLLLIMVTLVTLYTGKIQSFEHQIMLNSQNQKWAQAAAKSGLNQGLAMLNVNKTLPAAEILGVLDDNSSFTISAISEKLPGSRQLVTIKASGKSSDGLAKATIVEQSLVYPILFNQTPAPLMVKHGFSDEGEFELVVNPDGLGIGTPLSFWSDTVTLLSGSLHHSCILSEFYEGNCSVNAYSNHSLKLSDIADGSATFPSDLVSYLFNIPSEEWTQLQQQADFVLADCDPLDIGSWGVIWVNGDCEVSSSTQIGSESKPIILVVFDGSVVFQDDVVMYGLMFSFKPDESIKVLDINMQKNSAVFGSIVANHQLGTKNGSTRVVFLADVMQKLQDSTNLQRVARVPGSWHDF